MPRTRWVSWAVAIAATALTSANWIATAQDPSPKAGASRKGEAGRPDRGRVKRPESDPAEMPEKGDRPDRSGDPLGDWNQHSLASLRALLMGDAGIPPVTINSILAPNPAVQKELKLNDKQKAGLQKLAQTMKQEQGQLLQLARDARENDMFDPEEMRQAMAAVHQKDEQAVNRILTPDQRRRLAQIALQIEGPLAVAKPDMVKKLRLSQAQVQAVQEVVAEMRVAQEQYQAARRESLMASLSPELNGGDLDQATMMSRARRMERQSDRARDKAVQQVVKVLKEKQKAAFDKMLGEPFDLAQVVSGAPRRPAPDAAPAPAEGDRAEDKAKSKDQEKEKDGARPKGARPRGPSRKGARPPVDPGP